MVDTFSVKLSDAVNNANGEPLPRRDLFITNAVAYGMGAISAAAIALGVVAMFKRGRDILPKGLEEYRRELCGFGALGCFGSAAVMSTADYARTARNLGTLHLTLNKKEAAAEKSGALAVG